MRQKNRIVLLIALCLLAASALVAAAAAEENMAKPAGQTAVIVGPESRLIKYPSLARWGRQIAVVNETGYDLVHFDLYSQAMMRHHQEQANLLTENLEDGQRRVIDLLSSLLLFNAIAERDGELFYYSAINDEGDYYWGQWNPAVDNWNITITFANYVERVETLLYPRYGESLAVLNKTEAPLVSFSMEWKSHDLFDGSEHNLIENIPIPAGQRALIPTSTIPLFDEVAGHGILYYRALDSRGVLYRGSFYPDARSWSVTVNERAYHEGGYTLFVNNLLEDAIWYLWAMSGEEYLGGNWGDDVLGSHIIMAKDGKDIDLYENDLWAERLQSGWQGRLYLIAQTNEGERYFTYTELDSLYPDMFVNIEEQDRIEQGPEEDSYQLIGYNRTGEKIWYLYAVTGLDEGQSDSGEDLLGDEVWQWDDFITISVEDEDLDESGIIRFYAIDWNDGVYMRTWSPGAERVIVFRPGDKVE